MLGRLDAYNGSVEYEGNGPNCDNEGREGEVWNGGPGGNGEELGNDEEWNEDAMWDNADWGEHDDDGQP